MGNCNCMQNSSKISNKDVDVEGNENLNKKERTSSIDFKDIVPVIDNNDSVKPIEREFVLDGQVDNKIGNYMIESPLSKDGKYFKNINIDEKKTKLKLTEVVKKKIEDYAILKKEKKTINIILLGDKCVGKSSILYQYISNMFDQYYITTILKEDFKKEISLGSNIYSLYMTVTSGDKDYQGNYSEIYKITDFFLVVFDLGNKESFLKAKEIINNEIIKYIGLINEGFTNVVVVGNKSDLNQKVSESDISEYCKKYKFEYIQVSAKSNHNIINLFSRLAQVYDDIVTGI